MLRFDSVSFGRALSSKRIERNLTQAQLAELCGVSESHICSLERGIRNPSIEAVITLCYALEISPNTLLHGSLPENAFSDLLDRPLKLREPDLTLRNTLTNWYFADLPDESQMSEAPVTHEQLSKLRFTLLGEELPSLDFPF